MNTRSDAGCLLQVERVKKYFPLKRGLFSRTTDHVRAVDDVTFSIGSGETLGLVGESGSGKTTIGKLILRLEEPTGGKIFFEGENIYQIPKKRLRAFKGNIQIVFQNPFHSLNPRMSVERILSEGITIHKIADKKKSRERISQLLEMVKLSPEDRAKYPHEFSSGQRQRIGIARALSVNPKCIVADEPVSALDVSIQAQLLNLFRSIQDEFNVAFLFITHDLAAVRYISHRVAVLYKGQIVEMTDTSTLFASPLHPYTQALLAAVPGVFKPPVFEKRDRSIPREERSLPSMGCSYYGVCTAQTGECGENVPVLKEAERGHLVRCLRI